MKYIKTYENVTNLDLTDVEAIVLMRTAINEDNFDLARKLIRAGFDPKVSNADWLRLITSNRAKIKNRLDFIKELIATGIDLNITSGSNPLYTEVCNKKPNIEYVRLLFDCGADPNIKIRFGGKNRFVLWWSLLFINDSKVFSTLLEKFIKYGFDLSARDSYGEDFFDYLDNSKNLSSDIRNSLLKVIKKHFPKLYADYELRLVGKNYNL